MESTHTVPDPIPDPIPDSLSQPTPLAGVVADTGLVTFAGARARAVFSNMDEELQALTNAAGVYDLGWRARFRITGEDRVRWLNGMVTNTVKDLAPGHLNYTFLLNAQGRIQGDGEVYALAGALLFATDQAQAARLQAHLDRFIIMDDVELAVESAVTAMGMAGPRASQTLAGLGIAAALQTGEFAEADGLLVAREHTERYTIWVEAAGAPALWQRLVAAGAMPCGIDAVEALRILSGIPRYGADIHEKSLAQETAQMRALNFNKGCYLGQEIVERIRSRATVHRGLRAFRLQGQAPGPGTALFTPQKPDAPVGELTSITTVSLPEWAGAYALGTVRAEAAEAPLVFEGGVATALDKPPLGSPLQTV